MKITYKLASQSVCTAFSTYSTVYVTIKLLESKINILFAADRKFGIPKFQVNYNLTKPTGCKQKYQNLTF